MPTDPVCGMFVPEDTDLKSAVDGQTYYFCSKTCQQKYSSPEKEAVRLKRRLAVGWALALPIIIINYQIPGSLFHGQAYKDIALFIMALPVQFYSGFGFYEGAYHAVKSRSGNMDLLISMGTLTAFIFSSYVTFFPGEIPATDVYFDASAFIITLILTGNFIENLTKARANRAARKLLDLIPNTSHLIKEDGNEIDIPTDELKEGNVILVRPGESIPADGRVLDGSAEVDESMLTGEQEPVMKTKDDMVSSGTSNLNGVLKISVTGTGKNSTVSQIYELIQRAVSGRAKVQRIADVFSAIFVPVVIAAALASGLFWYFYLSSTGFGFPLEIAVLAFVSVVVIACPCAIGLAGPITLLISSNYASENGIIIKNTSALDRLSKVNIAVFDKTGTLTEPDPVITEIIPENGWSRGDVLHMAASVERSSNHPIARAIIREAERSEIPLDESQNVKEIPGMGISGTVDGREVKITRASRTGGSVVSIFVDGLNTGEIKLSYAVREGAATAITELRRLGIRTSMVTGDSKSEAERIARILGIDDVHAEVLPESKSEIIKEYQMKGDYVMFTGDGINDTVALETADVGIAMGSGTDIARESGDIILINNDLRQLILTRIIGTKTITKIKQNIGWAVGYNTVLMPVAGGVLVPFLGLSVFSVLPILAAFAMGMSSSSVVINSLMLRKKISREWKRRETYLYQKTAQIHPAD
ncbi:MAG: cadmium-translocating P-type ATPase [Candidatus Thermoplasmatota archaeon]|nr:cadmium-translocating P-type ATPase [Candidatus Thermoplasmatota archaeon]